MIKLVSLMLVLVLDLATCISCSNENATQTVISTQTIVSTKTITTTVTIPVSNIPFELIAEGSLETFGYPEREALIQVMVSTTPQMPQVSGWVRSNDWQKITETDYSQYFVIILFNGNTLKCVCNVCYDFSLIAVNQNEGTINITAHFDDIRVLVENNIVLTCNEARHSPYIILKIKREDLAKNGGLTFKLIDDRGVEKATVVQNIDQ